MDRRSEVALNRIQGSIVPNVKWLRVILLAIAVAVLWRLRSANPEVVGNRQLSAGANPSPIQSPVNVQASNSPSPTETPSRATPFASPTEPGQQIIALNDGPNKILLERSGKILETLKYLLSSTRFNG